MPVKLADAVKPKCRFCGKHRHPKEFIGGPEVGYCLHCLEWHYEALEALAGRGVPKGCPHCNRTHDELAASSPNGDVRMALHRIEGVYAFLCLDCDAEYTRKRRDQFGGTPHGAALGL